MENELEIFKNSLNEIIFDKKNKEYGAYILRKLYSKHVSISLLIAVIFFVVSTTSPLIIKYFTPKEAPVNRQLRVIDYTQLSEPPSIDKKEVQPQIEAPPPLKSTIKFLPPVVKPDADVTEEYIPSQEELKTVDPGKSTQEGDPTGVDYSLLEVNEPKAVEEPTDNVGEVFTFVEEMPSFPGGTEELMKFFALNIKYPEIAKRAGVEGKVFISFIVTKLGIIKDIQLAKGIGAGCDEEALSVVAKMPKWKPGRQNGSPVSVRVSIPIVFRLN
ncbi:MAG: energy transducer TonB [Ignavibacteriaceae bacterium]